MSPIPKLTLTVGPGFAPEFLASRTLELGRADNQGMQNDDRNEGGCRCVAVADPGRDVCNRRRPERDGAILRRRQSELSRGLYWERNMRVLFTVAVGMSVLAPSLVAEPVSFPDTRSIASSVRTSAAKAFRRGRLPA